MSQHTPDPSAAASPHASAAASDRAGHIETHGVDVIPDAERHGRPRELFWIWMSANVVYLYFVLGGVLMRILQRQQVQRRGHLVAAPQEARRARVPAAPARDRAGARGAVHGPGCRGDLTPTRSHSPV